MSDGAVAGNEEAKKILNSKGFNKPILVKPQLGIEAGEFINEKPKEKSIAFVGRIKKEKGIFFLLEAFEKIADEFPEWNLKFVGCGEEMENLRAKIKEPISDRIFLVGKLSHDETLNFLKNTSIFVLPSIDTPRWKEQFGHALIEAMAMGIPVIGSDGGEIPNVIGDAGLISQQGNVDSLSNCLRMMMGDDKLRAEYGMKGYHRTKKYFTHKAVARANRSLFQDVALQRTLSVQK